MQERYIKVFNRDFTRKEGSSDEGRVDEVVEEPLSTLTLLPNKTRDALRADKKLQERPDGLTYVKIPRSW